MKSSADFTVFASRCLRCGAGLMLMAGIQSAAAETVTSSLNINLRAEPDLRSAFVTVLLQGVEAEVVERSGEFMRVRRLTDGKTGWFRSRFAVPVGDAPTDAAVSETANIEAEPVPSAAEEQATVAPAAAEQSEPERSEEPAKQPAAAPKAVPGQSLLQRDLAAAARLRADLERQTQSRSWRRD